MSLGVALYNDPETISHLDNLRNLIVVNRHLISSTDKLIADDIVITPEILDELSDWLGDIHKILTDFSMFTQEEVDA
jgi:predicted ThiF/HesA family dinucleotide-utilizing enzyme